MFVVREYRRRFDELRDSGRDLTLSRCDYYLFDTAHETDPWTQIINEVEELLFDFIILGKSTKPIPTNGGPGILPVRAPDAWVTNEPLLPKLGQTAPDLAKFYDEYLQFYTSPRNISDADAVRLTSLGLVALQCPTPSSSTCWQPPTLGPSISQPLDGTLPETILFLASAPTDEAQLRLDVEYREISKRIRQDKVADRLEIQCEWAVRSEDLIEALLRHQPSIVHFSGHGGPGWICVEDQDGSSDGITIAAMKKVFEALEHKVRLLVLNCCDSALQLDPLLDTVPAIIAMQDQIDDQTAIVFAWSLYQALGFGQNLKSAVELARAQIEMDKLPGKDVPRLHVSPGGDAAFFRVPA